MSKDLQYLIKSIDWKSELKNVSIIFNGFQNKAKYGYGYGYAGYGYSYTDTKPKKKSWIRRILGI